MNERKYLFKLSILDNTTTNDVAFEIVKISHSEPLRTHQLCNLLGQSVCLGLDQRTYTN